MNIRLWRYFYLGYLWALPMTIAGFVIATVFYKAHSWQWRDGILVCVGGTDENGDTLIWGRPNAQTLGWLQIYDTAASIELSDLRVHENVHVIQAFVGGLVGMFFVPLLFAAIGWGPLTGLILGGFVGGLGFNALYGILFLYLRTVTYRDDNWYWAYRYNPFEVQAYDLQDKYIDNPNTKPWGA